jgi:hypothetical protein
MHRSRELVNAYFSAPSNFSEIYLNYDEYVKTDFKYIPYTIILTIGRPGIINEYLEDGRETILIKP